MIPNPLAALGSLLADPSRSEMLLALMDGRAHTVNELARHVGVTPSTASEHLSKLLDSELVAVEAQGRHRYYRLAGREVAELIETVGAQAMPAVELPKTPAALAFARTCYDHLAGQVAVSIYDALLSDGRLVEVEQHVELTASGAQWLEGLGADMEQVRSNRRPVALRCLDWTQRRHHLAGGAGAALLHSVLDRGWATRGRQPRTIRLTATGKEWFEGVRIEDHSA